MNKIIFGDCRDTMRDLIAQGVKVQMCVTSPPYFGLRDYGTGTWEGGDPECQHIGKESRTVSGGAGKQYTNAGSNRVFSGDCACGAKRVDLQLGLEQTPAEYVANMVEVFSLVWHLLADDGVLWLNLGDSYCSTAPGTIGDKLNQRGILVGVSDRRSEASRKQRQKTPEGLKPKDLIGIPWRVAFALQAAGWYLRQDIIWHKPNPMPESVTDRCTKAHEYMFLLSKSERYYFDNEAIKDPAQADKGNAKSFRGGGSYTGGNSFSNSATKERETHGNIPNDDGKRNRRSVWTIATTPYAGAHFATFPQALIEPCILAGSRVGDVVLDPFMGSGTTAQVSIKLGRQYLGCELNPAYADLQNDRTAQDAFVF